MTTGEIFFELNNFAECVPAWNKERAKEHLNQEEILEELQPPAALLSVEKREQFVISCKKAIYATLRSYWEHISQQ